LKEVFGVASLLNEFLFSRLDLSVEHEGFDMAEGEQEVGIISGVAEKSRSFD
jgi:hypothetical protein